MAPHTPPTAGVSNARGLSRGDSVGASSRLAFMQDAGFSRRECIAGQITGLLEARLCIMETHSSSNTSSAN